jgi:hypothetical protein
LFLRLKRFLPVSLSVLPFAVTRKRERHLERLLGAHHVLGVLAAIALRVGPLLRGLGAERLRVRHAVAFGLRDLDVLPVVEAEDLEVVEVA